MNAVNEFCTAIDLFLHPTILSTDCMQEMFRELLHVYSKTNGTADPDHKADVFLIRMKQLVE